VGTYGQFCPIARAAEVFAERWTPLILRELANGEDHFNSLARGCRGISPGVLGKRLRALEDVGIVERARNQMGRGSTYHLTAAGRELSGVLESLGVWGQRWLELDPEHLDADALMWRFYKVLDPATLPARTVVLRFEFHGNPRPRWLVLRRDDPDVCAHDPGLETDVVISADLEALVRVYLGELTLKDAAAIGLVRAEGPASLVRQLPTWIGRTDLARHARPRRYDAKTHAFVRAV